MVVNLVDPNKYPVGVVTHVMSISILSVLVLINFNAVITELSAISLGNVPSNRNGTDSCFINTGSFYVAVFNEAEYHGCSVQLTAVVEKAILMRMPFGIPPDTVQYVERLEKLQDCQKKYVLFEQSDEPCVSVFWHQQLKLFLQGNISIFISEVSANRSMSICRQDDDQQFIAVSSTSNCPTVEYDHQFSCTFYYEMFCTFEVPFDCNITLGDREVIFQCKDLNLSHDALFIYPANVTGLFLVQNGIVDISENHFTGSKYLETINLGNNWLTSLHPSVFTTLNSLTFLSLRQNHLTVIDIAVFSNLKQLMYLSLGDNELEFLEVGIFQGLVNLATLHLDGNKLETLHEDLFSDLNSLTELYLDNNELRELPSNVFDDLGNLKELDLYNNKFITLASDLFKNLQNIEILWINRNQLFSLDAGLLSSNSKLTKLKLSDNNLSDLPIGLFGGLRKIKTLHLERNQLVSLDRTIFNETNNLVHLYLEENNLHVLPIRLLEGLSHLNILHLSNNLLVSFLDGMLRDLYNLKVLFLHSNNLSELSDDLLTGLSKLEMLELSDNRLTSLSSRLFAGLRALTIFSVADNQLQTLGNEIFQDTKQLSFLDLSSNNLKDIPDLSSINKLYFLYIDNNKLTEITKNTFLDFSSEIEMIVSQEEICECYVQSDSMVKCTALDVRSPYMTCDRLLSDRVLMVMMWLIGLNAIGGNLFVLVGTMISHTKLTVQAFLLSNLAISDFLMGIYMLLIASADIYFGENFPMQAETWRSGVTCKIAGTISIFSSEASVFFVTLISIDRFINMKYPFSYRKLTRKSSIAISVLLWFISLALGLVPSVLSGRHQKFYDNSHVCIGLPLTKIEVFSKSVWKKAVCDAIQGCYLKDVVDSKSLGYVSGMYFATAMFLVLNCICYLLIMFSYIEIVRSALKSSRRTRNNPEMKEQIRMTINVAAVVLTDFFCWFPIIILGILVQAGVLTLPPSVFAWCVTFILPINSAINPYLYTISHVISSRRKRSKKGK